MRFRRLPGVTGPCPSTTLDKFSIYFILYFTKDSLSLSTKTLLLQVNSTHCIRKGLKTAENKRFFIISAKHLSAKSARYLPTNHYHRLAIKNCNAAGSYFHLQAFFRQPYRLPLPFLIKGKSTFPHAAISISSLHAALAGLVEGICTASMPSFFS